MERRRAVIWGAALILIGALALLNALGYDWVSMERLWPAVVIIGGLALAVTGFARDPHDTDNVWFGATAALCGGVFMYITVGPGSWEDLSWMWPVFPVAAGIGGLVAWLSSIRRVSSLISALIALAVGLLGFMYTTNRLGEGIWQLAADYWPLVLVLIGVGLIIEFLLQRGNAHRS